MRQYFVTMISALFLLGAVGCGGGSSDSEKKDTKPADTARQQDTRQPVDTIVTGGTVGAAGGTVSVPDGPSLEIPAGALTADVEFTITVTTQEPGYLPYGVMPVTQMVTIEPAGTSFDQPVTLTIPWDSALLPEEHEEDTIFVYQAPGYYAPWEPVDTVVEDGVLKATIHHLTDHVGASGCQKMGAGCTGPTHCCKPAVCVESTCVTCRNEGQSCGYGWDCCDPLTCTDGKCVSCSPDGGSCGHAASCCSIPDAACVGGKCVDCLPEGSNCAGAPANCCPGMNCLDSKCTKGCGQPGDKCEGLFSCCNWQQNMGCTGGICKECVGLGATCGDDASCCRDVTCNVEQDKCVKCLPMGAICSAPERCCSGACEGARCVECTTEKAFCVLNSQCCSGNCNKNLCQACPTEGTPCSVAGECCPGSCCEGGSPFACFEGTCQKCSTMGGGCSKDADCCGDAMMCIKGKCSDCSNQNGPCDKKEHCCNGEHLCIQGACDECHEIGESCGSKSDCCEADMCYENVCSNCHTEGQPCMGIQHCCEGFVCDNSKCTACLDEGAACGPGDHCCGNNSCLNGKCQNCIPEGDNCENNQFDCCTNACVDGKCADCTQMEPGDACNDTDKLCCPPLGCVNGQCELTCLLEGEQCVGEGIEMECCFWLQCMGGFCVDCAEEGDDCDEDPCCPGLECNDQEECEKPGGGGGECACTDEGVTLTVDSGCDGWPDATECSGWASVLIESKGWDWDDPDTHTNALAFSVESGTVICAFDCCIKITCP